jgi:prepilin-type processing-associated H-X9-DG protein
MSRSADRKKVPAYVNHTTTCNSPSERAIFADAVSAWLQNNLFYSRLSIRHENGANVAYVDGHVEFMNDKVMRSDLGKRMAIDVTESVSTAFGVE